MADLVRTSEAAKALTVSARSLVRWRTKGLIVADLVTPGGHLRWDIDHLRHQLENLHEPDA